MVNMVGWKRPFFYLLDVVLKDVKKAIGRWEFYLCNLGQLKEKTTRIWCWWTFTWNFGHPGKMAEKGCIECLGWRGKTENFTLLQQKQLGVAITTLPLAGLVPEEGTVLRIRADMRSRLADRNHQLLGGGIPMRFGGTSPKTNMTMENPPWMKMYCLLKMGIFQCHVSFQGCNHHC